MSGADFQSIVPRQGEVAPKASEEAVSNDLSTARASAPSATQTRLPPPGGGGLEVEAQPANPARGEASLTIGGVTLTLRPSFEALVRAEEELGPLLSFVEKVSLGGITLGEIVGLFWHCLAERPGALTRERLGEAVVEAGLAAATPILRHLIGQILKGL